MNNYDKVAEFNKRVTELRREHNLPGVTFGTQMGLIDEEHREVAEALDNYLTVPTDDHTAELVKELCDLLYVTYGMLTKLHGNKEDVFNLVHANNMRKFGEGAHFNVSGKLMKPEGFVKLTTEDILKALNSD